MAAALLPLGLAFLMAVVGLKLTPGGLLAAFRAPRPLLTGLAVQVLGLPLLALALASLLQLPPDVRTGLMIVAAAPGGITSNYAALLAGADVALSTAMTLVTNLIAYLTIPLILTSAGITLAGGASLLPLVKLSLIMAAVTAVPLLLGLALGRFAPGMVARIMRPLDIASRLVFAAIVLATFLQNWGAMTDYARAAGLAVVLLNLCGIGLAFAAATLGGLPRPQGFAIAIETGLQNVALAIFVASTLMGNSALALVGLVYAVVMNLTALGLIAAGRRRRE